MFLRCPNKLDKYVDKMVKICLNLMKWDPYYTYQDDDSQMVDTTKKEDDDEWGDEADGDWDIQEDGEDGDGLVVLEMGQDDTENTWKVRKAALRCLQAFISSRPQDQQPYFETMLLDLQKQFRERDDRVKAEVFTTASALI
eukprot:UN28854